MATCFYHVAISIATCCSHYSYSFPFSRWLLHAAGIIRDVIFIGVRQRLRELGWVGFGTGWIGFGTGWVGFGTGWIGFGTGWVGFGTGWVGFGTGWIGFGTG